MSLRQFFQKLFSPILYGNCLGLLALGAVLLGGTLLAIDVYTRHGQSVTVPNVRGQRIDIARQKLEAMGLRAEVVDTGYVDTYIGDVVLEQAIAPGRQVKAGRIVALTINAASARAIALPDIVDNCSRREAEARLRGLGFKNIRVEYAVGYKDWVTGLKIGAAAAPAGKRVSVVTLLTLVVGDGSLEDEFNGNDSLDYAIFGSNNEVSDTEILEDGGGEAPAPAAAPAGNEAAE